MSYLLLYKKLKNYQVVDEIKNVSSLELANIDAEDIIKEQDTLSDVIIQGPDNYFQRIEFTEW